MDNLYLLYKLYMDFFTNIGVPSFILIPIWYIIPFVIIAVALVVVVIILVLAERKILALFTLRKGPNRVGLWGCLQTIADAIKLLFKEDIISEKADKFLFTLAPLIVFIPVMLLWGLIPYSYKFVPLSSGVSLLLFLAILTVPVLGILLGGYASNNKYSLIGAIRSAAQVISYEIPMMLSILSIVVLSSSLDINAIILSQSSKMGIFAWYFIVSFIGFVVFFICSIAELNRVPFDLPEAESELVSGYNVEYSGIKFALFFLAEYAIMFILSAFIACIFFGGYLSPFGYYLTEYYALDLNFSWVVYIEQLLWLMIKTLIIVFVIIWIRATLPRLRVDRLMKFSWQFLVPISILNFFIICIIKYIQMRGC